MSQGQVLQLGGKKMECAANQVICNPLIFGVQGNGDPICLPRRGDQARFATWNCNARSLDFNNFPELPGIQDTWNEFASNFNSLCVERPQNQAARDFFCVECKSIRNRLATLTSRVLNRDCKEIVTWADRNAVPGAGQGAPRPGAGGSSAPARR